MKQKSLRAFSLVLIFALCLSLLSACDGEKVNILAEANSEPISNESKDMAYYAKTLLDEKNPLGIVGSVCPADGGIYIEGKTINYTDGTFKSALHFAEKNGEIKSVNSDWLGESNITGMCAAEGGGFWLVKSTYLSKDNAEHELGYFENGEYSRLSELEKTDKMFIQGLCAAKGRIFISESDARGTNLIKAYKPGGEKDFEVNVGGTNFDFVGDGALLYIGKHDESRAVKVCKLDPENRNIQELTSFDRGRLLACSGEKLYIGDSTGLVEYDTASKNTRRLFLWSECGLSGNTSSIWPQENGSFIVEEYSLIKNIYQDVKKERTQVVFAVNSNPQWFSNSAFKFNEKNPGYEVIIKDYGAYPDPQQMLNTDIISGKAPDLIDAAGFSGDMIKPGAMKDLLMYIKADPDLSAEDFLDGPLNAMKTEDGELLAITTSFYVCTILCRKGTVEGGNYESVTTALEKTGSPEEAFAGTFSRDSFLSLAFCCGGADKYSREDIAAIIEYASKLPLEEDQLKERENLRSGKQLAARRTLGSSMSLFGTAIKSFGCESLEELTILGLPFSEGTGVIIPVTYFTIPANAANAEGAWAFLKSLILPPEDAEYTVMNEYPILKKIYEISQKESEKFIRGYYEQERKKIGDEVKTEDIEQCFKLSEEMLTGLSGVCDENAKVYEIVNDACGAYFAGQKSAEATADEIMSRLNIYFSERK